MYKTVIFDLGKVLVHFDFQPGYRSLAELCPYSAEQIPRRIAPTGLVERLETGRAEPRAFFEELRETLGLRLDYEGFCGVWNGIFTEPLIPESLLAGLAARYRLLLLSNTNALHFEMLRERYHFLLRHFHSLILSYEVHAMKPNPEIYRAAIERAGCLPGECFYTDDIQAFVEGGRAMGLDAVQFENLAQLEREMKARGIRWESRLPAIESVYRLPGSGERL
jgi:putative hydrolase of the HAD superfamily